MAQIVPSILSADFARLAEDIGKVEQSGVRMLHVDIMDGHFVPNLTIGPPVVKSLRKATQLGLDTHLMIADPDRYAPLFMDAGVDQISVHYEAATHLDRTIRMIQQGGVKAGVALNPATPISVLEDVLYLVDYVLIMSVNPGFEGQKFIPNTLHKIRALDRLRKERRMGFSIEIDGGVSTANVAEIVRSGCDWLVAGSAVFHSADPASTVKEMQQEAADALSVKV
ncbi:MAG: ribulose-phosphate 3-epimerase [Acidobacteriota bacterium]|nr:ribulose-phosphate 3-epimerase [Acidobacteriota bacterium]